MLLTRAWSVTISVRIKEKHKNLSVKQKMLQNKPDNFKQN